MDARIKTLLEESESMTKEELVQELKDIVGEQTSEKDKWYAVGEGFWLRRTTENTYLCVQVFPATENSYMCYLQVHDITAYNKAMSERYSVNVSVIPMELPEDIRFLYPIAISRDTDSSEEMFFAQSESIKNEWLNKMGIKE